MPGSNSKPQHTARSLNSETICVLEKAVEDVEATPISTATASPATAKKVN